MDGWFPCLMPSIDHGPAAYQQQRRDSGYSTEDGTRSAEGGPPSLNPQPQRDYILTHGSYTILGSFPRPEQAQDLLDRACGPSSTSSDSSSPKEANLLCQLRTAAETEMCRFWPLFRDRFRYRGCQSSVLAKLRTECEFRSSIVFSQERVIYVFPGKISNIFRACDDVVSLIAAAIWTGVRSKDKEKEKELEDQEGADSGDHREAKEEGEVVIVDGYSIVKGALAEANEARSGRRDGGVSAGDVDVEVNDDAQGAESKGRSTCDLQTFERFQRGKMVTRG